MAPEPFHDRIYGLVRDLRAARLPRNRHFELHATPLFRAARRVHRFLRGVELDLRRATLVQASPRPEGGLRLELELGAVRFRRVVDLDARALALLLEDAAVRSALAGSTQPLGWLAPRAATE